MNTRILLALAGSVAAVSIPFTAGAAPAHQTTAPDTPDTCILRNGGDWNACNVGNSGSGALPYRQVVTSAADACILRNGGDWTACNAAVTDRGAPGNGSASR